MLSSFSNNFIWDENFYIEVISNSQSLISQILKVVSLLEKKSFILVPWDLKYKRIMILRSQNSSSTHSELFNDI